MTRYTTFDNNSSFGRCRVFFKKLNRSRRTRYEAATAIGANTLQYVVNTIAAEGALERTDHRLLRVRQQILATAFTTGSEF